MILTETLKRAISAAKSHILRNLNLAAEMTGEENPFGDKTLLLDEQAENLIVRELTDSDISFSILTEEKGLIISSETPEFLAVIDPIDGSSNLERGIPLCSIGISVIPYAETMTTDEIKVSIVESIFTDEIYIAERGKGVTRNGMVVHPSTITDPLKAIISYDTNRRMVGDFGEASFRTLSGIKDTRRSASNLLDLCWTACGALEGMIDMRDILPIVHVSGIHMVEEAGGTILGRDGKRLVLPIDMRERMSFIAAGTKDLAQTLSDLFHADS